MNCKIKRDLFLEDQRKEMNNQIIEYNRDVKIDGLKTKLQPVFQVLNQMSLDLQRLTSVHNHLESSHLSFKQEIVKTFEQTQICESDEVINEMELRTTKLEKKMQINENNIETKIDNIRSELKMNLTNLETERNQTIFRNNNQFQEEIWIVKRECIKNDENTRIFDNKTRDLEYKLNSIENKLDFHLNKNNDINNMFDKTMNKIGILENDNSNLKLLIEANNKQSAENQKLIDILITNTKYLNDKIETLELKVQTYESIGKVLNDTKLNSKTQESDNLKDGRRSKSMNPTKTTLNSNFTKKKTTFANTFFSSK